jgi:hypothetical protein
MVASMGISVRRRLLTALVTGCVALLVIGCSQITVGSAAHRRQRPGGRALPASVRGVPLLGLATRALGAAEAYGVSSPLHVRAVVTTQAALNAQVPLASGATTPEYVVTLRGSFSCGSCGVAVFGTTATTDRSAVRISTMVLQLPIPFASGATTGVAVGVGTPVLAKLGRVYDLDPYVESLAGASVPIGPVPG